MQQQKLETGVELPGFDRTINRRSIDLYARASGDFNPIHVDDDFAVNTQFGGVIAHGMMVLSYMSQMLTAAFGKIWFGNSRLDVRFKKPALSGDILTFGGIIRDINKSRNETLVVCELSCRNQNGEPVLIGEATIKI